MGKRGHFYHVDKSPFPVRDPHADSAHHDPERSRDDVCRLCSTSEGANAGNIPLADIQMRRLLWSEDTNTDANAQCDLVLLCSAGAIFIQLLGQGCQNPVLEGPQPRQIFYLSRQKMALTKANEDQGERLSTWKKTRLDCGPQFRHPCFRSLLGGKDKLLLSSLQLYSFPLLSLSKAGLLLSV